MSFDGDEIEEKVVQEEYKVWKKNTPFLYDLVMTHALEWPSLTVQWVPDATARSEAGHAVHKMIIGTHTSNGEQNHLMIASVNLPVHNSDACETKEMEKGGHEGINGKVEIKIKINHEGEVNRARSMPQNPFIIATKSPSASVYVFDVSKHPSVPADCSSFRPEHVCAGHEKEGYGLCWNPHAAGQLLSGSDDAKICFWDLGGAGESVEATRTWKGHADVIEDVSWHPHSPNVFGSVGDDKRLCLWDLRKPDGDEPMIKVENAHTDDINALAFNPVHEFLLATGSHDQSVKLWDIRNTSEAIFQLQGHRKEVFQLQWAPFNASVLASCGADRRVRIWDLSRIGNEQSAQDAEEGPPELLFVHGGHTSKVSDFSWNSNGVVASVSEDNVLQIWQMADTSSPSWS